MAKEGHKKNKSSKEGKKEQQPSPFEAWLNSYSMAINAHTLMNPEELKIPDAEWNERIFNLAIKSEKAEELKDEAKRKEFIGSKDKKLEFLASYAENAGKLASETYKTNKDTIISKVPEKGLAKIIYGIPVPEMGNEKGKYAEVAKMHGRMYDLSRLVSLLKEDNEESAKALIEEARKIVEQDKKEYLNKPFYKDPKNKKLRDQMNDADKSNLARDNSKGIVAKKIEYLRKNIDETLKDDKSKANYVRYLIGRLDDQSGMNILFSAYVSSKKEKKKGDEKMVHMPVQYERMAA